MANKHHLQPWEVNQSDDEQTSKIKKERRQPGGQSEDDGGLKEVRQLCSILVRVEKLFDICYEKSLNARSTDEEDEWLIALENIKLFHVNLGKDLETAPLFLPSADRVKTPQPQIRSFKDVEMEFSRLTMRYFQQPGVWNRRKIFKDGDWVVPNFSLSARTHLKPVETDESPHSSQSTISSSSASEQQPEGPIDSDKLPSLRSLELYWLKKAFDEHPPAYQSFALVPASPSAPAGEPVDGALGSSGFARAPPRAPPQNPPQLSSLNGSGLTYSTMPTPDKVEAGFASLPTIFQPFPTPANNAAERRSSLSDYNYLFDPMPHHNYVEMPSLSGSHAYSSQPCGYVTVPPSFTSCARAQPASASGRWESCLSPTAVQAYNESSDYNTEEQPLWPESAQYKYYPISSPDWNRFPAATDLSLYHGWTKGEEDSNRCAQPCPKPLIFNGPVHAQPALSRAQFDHIQRPRPAAFSRGTQTSPEPLSLHNSAQRQPALDTTQFIRRPTPRPSTLNSSIQSYPELQPSDNRIHWQPALDRVQFDHPQPPRPAVSSRTIQPRLEHPAFYDPVSRQSALNSSQFEHQRRFPATCCNPIRIETFRGSRSYPEQTAGDTAYLQPPRPAPANNEVNPISTSSNDTDVNHSPAGPSTSAPGCVEEVTITRKWYYPE